MKNEKTKYLIVIVLMMLAILTNLLCSCTYQPTQQTLANECVRIHIRANSNLQEDQQVKLEVRDAITAYLQTKLENCKTKESAIDVLQKEKQNLVNIANNTLYQHNFTYKSTIALTNEYFPDREYDGYTFPAGNYDALILELGSGKGDNWWCVAFPPLCFVPDANGEKVVYKSWIKELLDKIFKK